MHRETIPSEKRLFAGLLILQTLQRGILHKTYFKTSELSMGSENSSTSITVETLELSYTMGSGYETIVPCLTLTFTQLHGASKPCQSTLLGPGLLTIGWGAGPETSVWCRCGSNTPVSLCCLPPAWTKRPSRTQCFLCTLQRGHFHLQA